MRAARVLYGIAVGVLTVSFLFSGGAQAQTVAQRKALLKQILDATAKIPPAQKKLLSSGAQNFLNVAQKLNTTYVKGGDDGGLINGAASPALAQPANVPGAELFPGLGAPANVHQESNDALALGDVFLLDPR